MTDTEQPTVDASVRNQAWCDIILYGLARLVLFLVLMAVIHGFVLLIHAPVPLMISALLALLIAFPLSMFVFKKLRLKVMGEMAEWDSQRKARKQWIKDELEAR
ncbi:MAG: DUF4229 domain-containing protein [Corynebacterium sp.]|nr:DUF4229 domain-containing protein [Corynebacterium sp.]